MMRSFCDDHIINQAICYFNVLLCFCNFCASEKAKGGSEQLLENVGKLVSNGGFKAPKAKRRSRKPGCLFGSEMV